MIRVKFNDQENRVSIWLRCKLEGHTVEREFNLNRSQDEEIGVTFEKLYANYQKHLTTKTQKIAKKQKTDLNSSDSKVESPETAHEPAPICLLDKQNQPIDRQTKNKHAWIEDFTLMLNEQTFRVCVNLPSIDKISLPKLMLAGLPTVAKIECSGDYDTISRHSMFNWYASDCFFAQEDKKPDAADKKKPKAFDLANVKWELIDQGRAKRSCLLGNEHTKRLIRVECVPSDGKREGVAVEAVAANPVAAGPDLEKLPMFERHKLTADRMDSNSLRIITYNILANCYSETAAAKEELFAHCPLDYLDFRYRRILLLHEIQNYNSDVIFLQECERDFFRDDLMASMGQLYEGRLKLKGESNEGEAIMFRSDQFKFIQSHDISITQNLTQSPLLANLWANICKNTEYKEFILKRNTVLQVVQVELKEHPGHHLLLANTHFFFQPNADFMRLLQAIVSVKYLEGLKNQLLTSDAKREIKQIGILFGGDLNSDCASLAFKYIFSRGIPGDDLSEEEKEYLVNCGKELHHSLDLSIYADFRYTNFVVAFQESIDHLFYETGAFELSRVIPMPPHEKIVENIALPSKYLPSDHLALVFEFKLKSKQ